MVTYRIGIIGLGLAGTAQIRAFQSNPRTDVVAVCTRSPERLAEVSSSYGIPKACNRYEELLDAGLDVAVICTPDHVHTEYAVRALEAGLHVLCEKPLATTLEDLRLIVKQAKASGRVFMTGQCARFFDRSLFARGLVDREELGDLFFGESDYLHDCSEILGGWRVDPAAPQDMVLGGGCHPVDLLRWYLGDVVMVHAFANRKSLPVDCPIEYDCILMSLRFASGAIGKVFISIGCKRPYSLGLSLYGTEGTMVDDQFYLARYSEFEDFMDAKLPRHSHDVNTIFERQARHLVECLDKGCQPMADALEGAKTAATCIAGIESLRTGKPISVPEIDGSSS